MSDPREEIKSRLDIADVLREYIRLTPAGANFRANCPFHNEKTPSFMVSPARQIWHCFGCSEGGDIFSFVMKHEGLNFGEALRLMANKAGVELPRYDSNQMGSDAKSRIYACLDMATEFFYQALVRAPQAQFARDYATKRGLTSAIIDDFRLGYALPDFDRLYQFLISKKFHSAEILQAGLVAQKQSGQGCIDRFRDRLIIPLRNVHGQIIGFGGRLLSADDKMAKYINSPQTEVYDKSNFVFNLDRAKNHIRIEDAAILVEGYMDVIASWEAGAKNVVAVSGTALTVQQIKLLKRFSNNLLFSLDTDGAGSQATMRGITLALAEGANVKVVMLPTDVEGKPKYKDPDECIRADKEEWLKAVAGSVPFVSYYFSQLLNPTSLSDAYNKKTAVRKILTVIALIPDRIEQDHWINDLARRTSINESILWEELKALNKKDGVPPSAKKIEPLIEPLRAPTEELVGLLLQYPMHVGLVVDRVPAELVPDLPTRRLYEAVINSYNKVSNVPTAVEIDPDRQGILTLLVSRQYPDLTAESALEVIKNLTSFVSRQYFQARQQDLQNKIQAAEAAGDTVAIQQLMLEYKNLQQSK